MSIRPSVYAILGDGTAAVWCAEIPVFASSDSHTTSNSKEISPKVYF